MNKIIEAPYPPERYPESLQLAKALEQTDDENELKEKLGLLLEKISQDLHTEFTHEVSQLYREMRSDKCLARIESLSRVLEAVELSKPLRISDEDETHYANAVIPEPDGLKLAFAEGQAPGPIRAVVGFGKTLIGFKTDHLTVEEVEFIESDFRDAGQRKYLCRHVVGNLDKDDIKYLVIRIPSHLVDAKYLTPEEESKKSTFIFRGMRL